MLVHEISGVVPSSTITDLLRVVGVDEGGISLDKGSNGFEPIRKAVKAVGREGWSAGQVLEQVSAVAAMAHL
jgi:replication factor C subunit 2/4